MKTKPIFISQKIANLHTINNVTVIRLAFPFSYETINEIKKIEGRHFNTEKRYWIVPLTVENVSKLTLIEFEIQKELADWTIGKIEDRDMGELDVPLHFKCNLYKFQKQGLFLIEKFKGRALLADEMGLGKTIQAIAYTARHPEFKHITVVCPNYLKTNWKNEFYMLTGQTAEIATANYFPEGSRIVIINYDIVSKFKKQLIKQKSDLLIIDEAHFIKNKKTIRTKAVKSIAIHSPKILALTGTPIENKPSDIYVVMKILNEFLFPNEWSFLHTYCGPKNNGFGWQFNGATNTDKLHSILVENIMIRRLKKDVLQELPDKQYTRLLFEINNRDEYNEVLHDFVAYVKNKVEIDYHKKLSEYFNSGLIEFNKNKLKELQEKAGEKALPIAQIEVLKQLSTKGKLKGIIEWVENFFESKGKLVLFCDHIFVIDALMAYFSKIAVKVDGRCKLEERDVAVQAFQTNKKVKLFIGNSAAQTGLTLTAASDIGIIEFPWNPAVLSQRIDRIHRIGQKNAVNVYYFLGEDTIDVDILILLGEKESIAKSIIDGDTTIQDFNMVDRLIEIISKK